MKITVNTVRFVAAIIGIFVVIGAVAFYRPVETRQIGFDGVAMQVQDNEQTLAERRAANVIPQPLPPSVDSGVLAAEEYENVQVLGHLNTAQFTRLMTSITTWIAPQQGCAYCHNTNNLASDELYTKVVSRRMLQMTMQINENWGQHVGETGVTCWTCHRGQAVPEYIWFEQPEEDMRGLVGYSAGQNHPDTEVGLASLPGDPFETYLSQATNIRVQGNQALPGANRSSIKQTEWTYGLMMHFSTALGVNCTYCHNSRVWGDWSQSPAVRATAWYGIRMVRNINHDYLESLEGVFPANRLGPTGDVPKTNCATCHQGAYRPLLGQSMLDDFPSLARSVAQPVIEEDPADDFIDEILEDSPLDGEGEVLEDDGDDSFGEVLEDVIPEESLDEDEPLDAQQTPEAAQPARPAGATRQRAPRQGQPEPEPAAEVREPAPAPAPAQPEAAPAEEEAAEEVAE